MAEVRNAAELGEAYRHRVSEVFCAAFAEDFRWFAKNPALLADAFAHALLLERFWVTLIDGSVAAVASLTADGETCLRHDPAEFRRHLGPIRGRLASMVFRSSFETARQNLGPATAEIGFVGSAPQFRGRGAARTLLQQLIQLPQYQVFVLEEIKDTNVPALGLYRSLGFAEYKRRRVHHSIVSGFHYYVSMKLTRPAT